MHQTTSEQLLGQRPDGLSSLLNHLQGNGPTVEADAGLARLSKERLQAIRHGARMQSLDCLHDLQNLAQLLAVLVANTEVGEALHLRLRATSSQLCRLAEDAIRWQELSESATYYEGNPTVAQNVARLWSQCSHHLSEWPIQETAPPVLAK